MIAPVPGESILHNLSATLLKHGNTATSLGSDAIQRIARFQGLDADELKRELTRQEKLNTTGFTEECDK